MGERKGKGSQFVTFSFDGRTLMGRVVDERDEQTGVRVLSVYLAVYYLVIHAAWMSFEQLLVAWELISVCG